MNTIHTLLLLSTLLLTTSSNPTGPILGIGPVINCAGRTTGKNCGSFGENHWVQSCPENAVDRCDVNFVCHSLPALNGLPNAACFSAEDAKKLDDPFLPFQGPGPVIPSAPPVMRRRPFLGHGPVITCAGRPAGTHCGAFGDNQWVQTCPENKINRCQSGSVCHKLPALNGLPNAACFRADDA